MESSGCGLGLELHWTFRHKEPHQTRLLPETEGMRSYLTCLTCVTRQRGRLDGTR